jgi:hypothetical protein
MVIVLVIVMIMVMVTVGVKVRVRLELGLGLGLHRSHFLPPRRRLVVYIEDKSSRTRDGNNATWTLVGGRGKRLGLGLR